MKTFEFLKGKKILLVEDEYFNQELMSDIFEESECDLCIVNNGVEAVKKFVSVKYDIILMDVQMPIMDGYTATEEIRKIEIDRSSLKTPIIAITANSLSGDRERCLKVGMDDYLSKPINIMTLMTKLQKLI